MTRRIIGSLKLNPTTSAPTAAKGVMYYNDTDSKLKVSNDGSTFVDVGSAVSSTYDAVVAATGGDYTTLGAAITAGKTSIFIKDGTYVETGAITLPANCMIVGESREGAIVNMQTNLLTTAAGASIQNCTVKSSRDRSLIQVSGNNNFFFHVTVENTLATASTDTGALIAIDAGGANTGTKIIGCKFIVFSGTVDNSNKYGVNATAAATRFQMSDCEFIGAGSSYHCYAIRVTGGWSQIDNVLIRNFGKSANNFCLFGFTDKAVLTGFTFESCIGNISFDTNTDSAVVSNWSSGTSAIQVDCAGDYVIFNNVYITGNFNVTTDALANHICNSVIEGVLTITGDRCCVTNCRIGAAAGGGSNSITIAAAADNTIVSNTYLDAAPTDGGTNSTIDYTLY